MEFLPYKPVEAEINILLKRLSAGYNPNMFRIFKNDKEKQCKQILCPKYKSSALTKNNDSFYVKYISPDKGKGVFTNRSYQPDEIILVDLPLIAMQHEYNKEELASQHCSSCLQSIQIDFKEIDLPSPCHCSCGNVYCSEKCKHAMEWYHNLLCKEENVSSAFKLAEDETKETHTSRTSDLYLTSSCPLEMFRSHAIQTNEMFFMAGHIIAMIIARWFIERQNILNEFNSEVENAKFLINDVEIIERAMQPFKIFSQLPWWHVIDYNEEDYDGEGGEEEYREIFRQLCVDSLELLCAALVPWHKGNRAILELVFNVETYGCIMGIFEMNNISIEFPVTLNTEKNNSITDDMEEKGEKEENNDTDFNGVGLFPIIATMNHSCTPNVFVTYTDKNSMAYVRCGDKAIEAGEELCYTYIDINMEHAARQKALQEYHFECHCDRCISEEK